MDKATILRRLEKARDAYDALITGNAARVIVDQNGARVEYISARSADLRAYIRELEAQLATASGTGRPVGPLRFIW